MKKLLTATCAVLALSSTPALAVSPTAANGYTAGTPLPIDNWAVRDVISAVEISPDGKHILVMKIESKKGEHVLEVYETANMSKPLRRLNADPMEFISAQWVTDDVIFGRAWQVVRKSVKSNGDDVREYKAYSYNLKTNKFSESRGASRIVSLLPKEPNAVLIATGNAVSGSVGVDPFAAFRPQSYYRYDLETGAKSLVLKGTSKYANVSFDIDGNPRYAVGRDGDNIIEYYRKPGDNSWTEFSRLNQNDKDNLYKILGGFQGFAGVNQSDPSKGYMIAARNGDDKAALYEFNFNTGQYGQKLASRPDADIMGVQTSSNYWGGQSNAVAAVYPGAKFEKIWLDQSEKSLIDKLSRNITNAHSVSIQSRTRDGQSMIVYNSGPKDPGSYYYYTGNKMVKLGSRNPLVKSSDLSNVEFVRYKARDGKMIPAYITKPKGAGPFPTIVLPHGGPHVNEVVGYDEWGQMLANNGYLVIQPQYRMSVGWGKDHFDSAYGQHGLAMQDDKDDGATYLVQRGLADPDRIAMYGWSYGGYAALVAASRTPQLYQCVIAGAAVADPEKSFRKGNSAYVPKAILDWAERRGTIGINPINEIDKVNIPVMMVHGDVDNRVEYFHYKDYRKEMESTVSSKSIGKCSGGVRDTECTTTLYRSAKGKADSVVPLTTVASQTNLSTSGNNTESYTAKSRFVTLEGADHFYVTLMYDHQKELYTEMLDFLKNDCGPGGL